MKFKSKIEANEQALIILETTDYYNGKSYFREKHDIIENEDAEKISSTLLISEGISILDMQLWSSTFQTIENKIIGESVVLNFIFCNTTDMCFNHVKNENNAVENIHNILYVSDATFTYEIPAFEEINCLSIILSMDYYYQLIHGNWGIHKTFSENINRKTTAYLQPKYVPLNSAIQWILYEIQNCKYEGAIKKMYLEAKIKELLILQLESLTTVQLDKQATINDEEFNKLLEAKMILESSFTNAPTLPELSRAISLNEFKLKKGFKACFATTVKGYVTKLRMEHAKDLFKNKTSSVGEVAYKCGYKDASHFSAAFKLFYGFNPISFRNMNIKFQLIFWGLEEFIPNIYILI